MALSGIKVLSQEKYEELVDDGPLEEGVEYLVKAEDGVNQIPLCPTTTAGTYTLQCVVASGVATYSWVAAT